jgi:hypothetical protein
MPDYRNRQHPDAPRVLSVAAAIHSAPWFVGLAVAAVLALSL